MKKVKILTLAGCLAVLSMSSCQKGQEAEEVKSGKNPSKISGNILSTSDQAKMYERYHVANPENMFDYAGQQHNQILDAAEDFVAKTGKNDWGAVHSFIVGYTRKGDRDIAQNYNKIVDVLKTGLKCNFDNVINLKAHSSRYREHLKTLLIAMQHIENVPGFLQTVKNLETKILSDKLSDQEKQGLLMTTSVARYSSTYWYERRDRLKHNFQDEMPKWLKEILAVQAAVTMDALAVTIGWIFDSEFSIEAAGDVSWATAGGIITYW
ncbi:hypothetical protein [Pedobacter frigoris]|uniref:hypothetical protein n=1 Tax=Pedobacter frigoris TaxID=2571272 RepID=UPI0029303BD1|nr:hypothetical protein [Pedobacter frigoris]